MTNPPIDSNLSKSKGMVFLEHILFALCLCVIALRTTFTEGLPTPSAAMQANLWDNVYSLSVSAVLLLAFACWLIWSFCSKRFLYRLTGMEIGLCLFCISAVIAVFAASNKRLAITNFVTLLAPVIMAVLLVQILDSHSKIKLLLCVIAALAVVCSYQSAEQFLASNQMTIDQYEEAPQTILEPLGIEPNTLQHFLFEHRLYSKGVRGFFTTRNSAGSFLLMASFAAGALFIDKFKNRKSGIFRPIYLYACGAVILTILFALALTRSKGAILGLFFATVLFFTFLVFGNRLKDYNKIILISCLLLFIVGGCVVAWYGLTHERFAGGNSMLVRWQYWNASAKMYADHPLTGVGPGNFTNFYPHYKPAGALESVADPHNFPLSILTQYGPLGLIGFLAMIFIPLWKASFGSTNFSSHSHQYQPTFGTPSIVYLIVITTTLLLIRPMIMHTEIGNTFDVMLYLILTLYIAPAAVFIIGFWLLIIPLHKKQHTKNEIPNANTAALLFCAILGVILHNQIDFAIFEPPVLTTFWAIMACLIATYSQQNIRTPFVLKPTPAVRILMVTIPLAATWAYFNYALIPAAKSTAKIQKAQNAIYTNGNFQQAYNLLSAAAEDDRLDPAASNLNGRFYLQDYHETGERQPVLLEKAEQCFLEAIARDAANFKNYEKLSDVYDHLGRHQNAYDRGLQAAERYPGAERIQYQLAQIAEKLKKTDEAIEHYKKAIEIEDNFRRQFKIMYPDRKTVSRLGEDKYKNAIKRMEFLTPKQIP